MATCLTCGRDFLGSSATDTVCPQCVSAAPPLGRAIVTPILLGILTLVYVLMVVSGVSPVEPTIGSLVSWGADFGPYTLSGEWWRTLTSTFLHIGFLHLALNGWCLWRLGRMAEPLLGSGRFAALYLLSGLGGSLVSLAVHPLLVSAGASAAIFGVAGSLIALRYLRHLPLTAQSIRSSLKGVVPFVIYNLLGGLEQGIDNAAHLGGLVSGFALGALLPLPWGNTKPARARTTAVLSAFAALMAGGAAFVARLQAPVAAFGTAAKMLEAGEPARALPLFLTAVAARPTFPAAQYNVGITYLALDSVLQAIAPLRVAVRLDSTEAMYRNELGIAYLRASRIDSAIVSFAKTTSLAPGFAGGQFNLGLAYMAAGRSAEALAAFDSAVALDSTYVAARHQRGTVYRQRGEDEQARADFQWVVDQPLGPPEQVALVANARRQLEELDRAARYRAAPDLRPHPLQSGLDSPPSEYLCPALVYPPWLKGSGARGLVTAEFIVDSSGLVQEQSIRVVSQENQDLTAAAVDRLKQCGYVPGRRSGRPVPVRVRQSWRVVESP